MNTSMIWAVARKDMSSIWRTSKVWIGLILLPLLFGVLFPAGLILLVRTVDMSQNAEMAQLLKVLPPELLQSLPTERHRLIYVGVNFLLAPLFMLIPVINALMIAVNSFVGEKEQNTLESLLFSPLEIKDLFLGKLLASFIPSYTAALASFVLSGLLINVLAYPLFQEIIFPNANWLIMLLWVAPAFTFCTILFSVWVSARSKTFQEAQQIGGVIVLPIVGLIVGQSTGLLVLGPTLLLILGFILWGVSIGLLSIISKMNQRDALFERQVQ
ncbi:ABC transporter permease subunit [Paenibacillus sp. JSM ZJ436]|uniref:ABC transporter permease subunit n=1 Tax=Paenibacillus sp. JSM ZJ436 TaxID=3376190 RepID=UPI00379C279F